MPRPASFLSTRAQQAIHAAIGQTIATFFNDPVTLNHRVTIPDANGENPVVTTTPYDFLGNMQYNVGQGGRYHTVERTDMGQMLLDGWKVYLYKEEVDASGLVFDPEADSATINGKEYEVRFWSSSTSFADLGMLLYEFELHFNKDV